MKNQLNISQQKGNFHALLVFILIREDEKDKEDLKKFFNLNLFLFFHFIS